MRDFAKIRPQFWTKGTGKRLRGDTGAQVVAFYLMTCPSHHATGLFYLPLPTITHELGLPPEPLHKALERLKQEDFAHFDPDHDLFWVVNAAREQIGDELNPRDNNIQFIRKWVDKFDHHPFYAEFLKKYGKPYHLIREGNGFPSGAPSEPQAKRLRSQEKEKEQEKDPPPSPPRSGGGGDFDDDSEPALGEARAARRQVWSIAYEKLYATRSGGLRLPKNGKYEEHLSVLVPWSIESSLTDDQCRAIVDRFFADRDPELVEKKWWIGYLVPRLGQYVPGGKRSGARSGAAYREVVDP